MNNDPGTSRVDINSQRIAADFWKVFLNHEQLRGCDNLEKLVAGCEVIAALDHMDELLAA